MTKKWNKKNEKKKFDFIIKFFVSLLRRKIREDFEMNFHWINSGEANVFAFEIFFLRDTK